MTIHAPVPDYAAAREAMVDTQLRPQGVNYPPLEEAMATVEREAFVAEGARPLAYIDRAVPMGDGRLMSAPIVVGRLLNEMTPLAGERALVVGCGTGYSAAVLMAMGLEVVALESSTALAERGRSLGIEIVEGPLEEGWKKRAPYHLILIDGAVETIPETIINQLTDHGRLGTALIDRGVCRLAVGRKAGGGFGLHTMADAGAAALPGFAKPRTFTF
ncbi:MAG TPA: protein-L-isoaspartate O-methyltransferase [Sphingomicrobium sp.]|jgi:protein-L-isoaspartate(D-aspartate) O-methyltransferase|nr:protein-L-isoaspartate O-methyltransferase [Sphingomicrobium sp.]